GATLRAGEGGSAAMTHPEATVGVLADDPGNLGGRVVLRPRVAVAAGAVRRDVHAAEVVVVLAPEAVGRDRVDAGHVTSHGRAAVADGTLLEVAHREPDAVQDDLQGVAALHRPDGLGHLSGHGVDRDLLAAHPRHVVL